MLLWLPLAASAVLGSLRPARLGAQAGPALGHAPEVTPPVARPARLLQTPPTHGDRSQSAGPIDLPPLAFAALGSLDRPGAGDVAPATAAPTLAPRLTRFPTGPPVLQ